MRMVFMEPRAVCLGFRTIASRHRTIYNRKSDIHLQESGNDRSGRSARRNRLPAPTQRRPFQAGRGRRPLGGSPHRFGAALLPGDARRLLQPDNRRAGTDRQPCRQFPPDPGGARLHHVEPRTALAGGGGRSAGPARAGPCQAGAQGRPARRPPAGRPCTFGSPDAALLVSLLPDLVVVQDEPRLATLVQLVRDESREQRPGRGVILARLLEVLFIEALRSAVESSATPGLVRGLADRRLAAAIRRMHQAPAQPWTVAELAREAALSRSTFFERFSSIVGVAPMEYLLGWRMALAKNLLRRKAGTIAEIAERVGYGSASTFSTAFTRFVGMPPTHYAKEP